MGATPIHRSMKFFGFAEELAETKNEQDMFMRQESMLVKNC